MQENWVQISLLSPTGADAVVLAGMGVLACSWEEARGTVF